MNSMLTILALDAYREALRRDAESARLAARAARTRENEPRPAVRAVQRSRRRLALRSAGRA